MYQNRRASSVREQPRANDDGIAVNRAVSVREPSNMQPVNVHHRQPWNYNGQSAPRLQQILERPGNGNDLPFHPEIRPRPIQEPPVAVRGYRSTAANREALQFDEDGPIFERIYCDETGRKLQRWDEQAGRYFDTQILPPINKRQFIELQHQLRTLKSKARNLHIQLEEIHEEVSRLNNVIQRIPDWF